ncbi:MAG: ribosomal protein S18-alanine N-acetyltransferase [Gemmatimonadetes bacterium]|nr:ribosomal protein S18-alanine N-acetyltransferase [Gemmatimonadota bacterium]
MSTTAMAIRVATPADLDAVLAIEQASFSDPWTRGSFRSLLGGPHVYFPVLEVEGVLAGYAIALFAADEGELANLAVAPAWRGRGLGERLLDDVLAVGGVRGVRTTWLEVRESNAAARRLYARHGFVETGRRRRYYDDPVEDALVLRRLGQDVQRPA